MALALSPPQMLRAASRVTRPLQRCLRPAAQVIPSRGMAYDHEEMDEDEEANHHNHKEYMWSDPIRKKVYRYSAITAGVGVFIGAKNRMNSVNECDFVPGPMDLWTEPSAQPAPAQQPAKKKKKSKKAKVEEEH